MATFKEIVEKAREHITECFPWDVETLQKTNKDILLLDIREECEFAAFHIKDAMLVPRGILETACESEYEDSVPELVAARERQIIVICRSGNRSVLACEVMQTLGYKKVISMKTGLRGWNDYDLPLYNAKHELVSGDDAEAMLGAGFNSSLMHPDRRTLKT